MSLRPAPATSRSPNRLTHQATQKDQASCTYVTSAQEHHDMNPPEPYHTTNIQPPNIRSLAMKGFVLLILAVVLLTIKSVVLQDATSVTLQKAPPLSGQITQSFSAGDNGALPV